MVIFAPHGMFTLHCNDQPETDIQQFLLKMIFMESRYDHSVTYPSQHLAHIVLLIEGRVQDTCVHFQNICLSESRLPFIQNHC